LRENWARIVKENPRDLNKDFDEYPELDVIFFHYEMVDTHDWYAKSFIKMLCELGFIQYVQCYDIFKSGSFYKNYKDLFVHYDGNNPVKQGLCKYYDCTNTENWNLDDICMCIPNILHIYLCCIPDYVNRCIMEIAKMRAPLATIFTICCMETTNISPTVIIFADEFIIATIISFL
jgi:hypothetical protein